MPDTSNPTRKGKNTKKTPSPDNLVKTGKPGEIELTEDELKKATGSLKLDYKE